MKLTTLHTVTFDIGNGFLVDITADNKSYNSWLYHKDYCIKSMMFGCPVDQQTFEYYVQLVADNVDDYIPQYVSDYMD